jgi:8-amino-7-oxononanoate synthase
MKADFLEKLRDNPMMNRVREARSLDLLHYYDEADACGADVAIVDGRECIVLSTTNYLGLSHDSRVKRAAIAAIEAFGASCTASRVLYGTRSLHTTLEAELAEFLDKEAALVFATGYLANIGAIPALLGRHDGAVFDAEVHACLVDAIRLSGAKTFRFEHNSLRDLETQLEASAGMKKLVIIDSVYSLGGDIAPLSEIAGLSKRYGASLYVDDAHGIGVFGDCGRGLAQQLGVQNDVDVIMGVFSKAFGSVGGFVAGSAALIDYLRYNARSQVFSNALPPGQTAAALASLRIMKSEPELSMRTLARAAHARQKLREIGYPCGGDGGHMVPVLIGDDEMTLRLAKALRENGVLVGAAVPPAVPVGKALLRTGFTPTLTQNQLETVFSAFEKVGRQLGYL